MVHKLFLADYTGNLIGPGPTVTDPVAQTDKLVSNIIGILTILGVIYFAIQIILAGYAMLSSEGDPKKIEMSRDRLTQSVLGLFVVVVAVIAASLVARLAGVPNALDLTQQVGNLKLF